MSADEKGLIFDIQGHSLHDGPGTRTLLFFSGCPLRCRWCANPEGLLLRQRLMYRQQLCRNCPQRCVSACPAQAVRPSGGDPPVTFDHRRCEECDDMRCTTVCYTGALQTSGRWYTLDDLLRLLNRDRCYWGPEGGVTLTGGEPLLQRAFVTDLLEACREAHISAGIETSAYVPRAVLEAVLPCTDWMFVDLKHVDSRRHEEATGVPNAPILDNIRWLARSAWPGQLVVRTPVIPGFNDSAADAEAMADFLWDAGVKVVNLLPFHRLGASKYAQLGLRYDYAEQEALAPERLEQLAAAYRNRSIACYLGADTPF